jgi:hypothetical protein
MSVGLELRGQIVRCPHCQKDLSIPPAGAVPPGPTKPVLFVKPHVPSHLVEAILVTLLCCLPFGIVAIVYAARVDGKLAAGDHDGARHASAKAGNWCLAALICGLITYAAWVLLLAVEHFSLWSLTPLRHIH